MADFDYPGLEDNEEEKDKNFPPVGPPLRMGATLPVAPQPTTTTPAATSLVEPPLGTPTVPGPTLEDRLKFMRPAPKLEDFAPKEPHGWSKFGHFLASINPRTNEFINVLPQERAKEKFAAATNEWNKDIGQQETLNADELARAREARESRKEASEETKPEREAKAREAEWQQHHTQEQADADRRFGMQQDKWEKQQAESEQRQERREVRAEGRQEAREGRAEDRQIAKEGRANKLKLQKTVDAARDIDQLDAEQRDILGQVQKTGTRGMFGGGPYLNGPQSMQFLANHMALTIGRIKGARTGKDLIEAHIQARDLDQGMEALAQRILQGGVITYEQAQQMLGTTGVKRKSAWDRVIDEGSDYNLPVDDMVPTEFGGKMTPKVKAGGPAGGGAPQGASDEVWVGGKLAGHAVVQPDGHKKFVPLEGAPSTAKTNK